MGKHSVSYMSTSANPTSKKRSEVSPLFSIALVTTRIRTSILSPGTITVSPVSSLLVPFHGSPQSYKKYLVWIENLITFPFFYPPTQLKPLWWCLTVLFVRAVNWAPCSLAMLPSLSVVCLFLFTSLTQMTVLLWKRASCSLFPLHNCSPCSLCLESFPLISTKQFPHHWVTF